MGMKNKLKASQLTLDIDNTYIEVGIKWHSHLMF